MLPLVRFAFGWPSIGTVFQVRSTVPSHDGCDERNSILTIDAQGHIDLLVVTTRVEAVADLNPASAFPF